MQMKREQAQQGPDYGLRAHRYTGDMTLLQALKGNLGYPEGRTNAQQANPGSICTVKRAE